MAQKRERRHDSAVIAPGKRTREREEVVGLARRDADRSELVVERREADGWR
jgi:hypothetical protein